MNFNKRVIRQNSVSIGELNAIATNMTPPAANIDDIKPPGATTTVHRQIILPTGGTISIGGAQTVPTPMSSNASSNVSIGATVVTAVPSVVTPAQPIVDDAPVSLLTEIADIMRSFGDCDPPRPDSVKLIEQILQQQLRGIFNEASLVAMRRKNQPCPSQADFEFLMRLHPVKIARMRKHLKDMRILKRFLSIRTGRPQDFSEDLDQQDEDEELAIDVPELYDEERTRRLFRADRISQILTGQQYMEFNEARKTSFYCRHGEKIKNKFRRFLDLPADLRIPMATMNILAYFAHETIAVIVDYAILTRLNSDNRTTEPYSRVTSAGGSAAVMHVCPEVTQGRGMEVVKPISVQEIHEAMRRFRQMSSKKIGNYRSSCDVDIRRSFLAI